MTSDVLNDTSVAEERRTSDMRLSNEKLDGSESLGKGGSIEDFELDELLSGDGRYELKNSIFFYSQRDSCNF